MGLGRTSNDTRPARSIKAEDADNRMEKTTDWPVSFNEEVGGVVRSSDVRKNSSIDSAPWPPPWISSLKILLLSTEPVPENCTE